MAKNDASSMDFSQNGAAMVQYLPAYLSRDKQRAETLKWSNIQVEH